jgi:galactan 5-O-arabinofuranosyltransferase
MRILRWTPEPALVLAATAVMVVAIHALVGAIGFDATSPDAKGLGPVWAAAMVAIALAGQLVQRRGLSPGRRRAIVAVLAGIAAGLVTVPMMAGLHGTNQPLFTFLRGDMAFRTEYVTRFASTWRLQDYTLRGLHAFYPPAWFWLAGRTAHVLGVVPWRIIKPFTIGTVSAALLFAYALWRMVLTPAGALSAAIGSSLVLTTQVERLTFSTQAWYSPYSCFVAVTGVAWVAASLVTARRGGSPGRLAFLAVVGAVLALSYYLLFIILIAVLAALAAWPAPDRRAALRTVGIGAAAIGVLTAVFWIPLLAAVVRGSSAQGHFVRPDFLRVSLGLNGPPSLAILSAVAIVLLVVTFASTASQAVAGLLAGTVLYQLASVATLVVAHNQLQPHRAVTMMWATFGAAVPVAFDGVRLPAPRVLAAAALALAIPATFALGASEGSDLAAGPLTVAAHTPLNLAPSQATSRFITATTGRSPQQLTLLTEDKALLVTEPYYDFLPLRARYAHPEAKIPQRVAVLQRAATCPAAPCTARVLEGSRFGRIDALVLSREPGGYRIDAQEDGFPDGRVIPIYFRRGLLAPRFWARRAIGDYVVFVRQGRPVPKLNDRRAFFTDLATARSPTPSTTLVPVWR